MGKLAFVTYQEYPVPCPDDQLAIAILAQHGFQVEGIPWNLPNQDWSLFDGVFLRASWDYYLYPDAFLNWLKQLEKAQIPFWNSYPLVRWNFNKSYLKELETSGISIIPTCWIEAGTSINIQEWIKNTGWQEFVLKPFVSASAHNTIRFSAQDSSKALNTLQSSLESHQGVLLQKFIPEVTSAGEWSFLFFQGEYSHGVVKKPKKNDFRVQEEYGGGVEVKKPSQEILAQAKQVLKRLKTIPLYARVDGIEVEGQFLLMELELIEPFLFLSHHPQAPQKFADAILAVLKPL